ncbi:HupE/UreJ family protein [Muriicola sp.]|uniref:HupE/UreJ family protein n=1 Tax=Muriicola sp. TaxID=2020856 RepID=UPI003C74CC69
MRSIKLIFALMLSISSFVRAHEVRPAFFSMTQINDSTFQVVWKLPAMGNAIPKIYPILPDNWIINNEKANLLPGNLRQNYLLQIEGQLGGNKIYFEGLEKTLIDVLVSINLLDGTKYSLMVRPSNPTYMIPLVPNTWDVIKTYIILGIEHILSGIDHLLFVLALLLITKGFKRLVKTITAFTIAHSITLSLATLGIIGLPGPPVEATIALSIVFLAVELIHYYRGIEGYTVRYPWIVAFVFGLLHGFGFAGALSEIGLPQTEIPTSLLFFNVGVELGQLIFVIAILGLFWVINKLRPSWPSWVKWVPPYAIGSLASFWLIERCLTF